MTSPCDIGLIGLAVMGQNLVLNMASRGFRVSVYNRTPEVTQGFVARHPGMPISGADSLGAFVASLQKPRRIVLMVKAGAAVDAVLAQLRPLLSPDDIVIDGGNSLYTDTQRRGTEMAAAGFRFVGAGISGGEEGARKGPAIMPGGPASTWQVLRPVFEAIAAKVNGQPCVTHIGPDGAGHYVKMVHNGIEYGDMQLIAEAYHLLRAAGFSAAEVGAVFDAWNEGPLQSYLVQITGKALAQIDAETGLALVDLIQDKAGQKGTGRWTLINAAEMAVAVGTMNAAVEARVISASKPLRMQAASVLHPPPGEARPARPGVDVPVSEGLAALPRDVLVAQVHDALYASKVVSYAQGFALMRAMGEQQGWALDLGAIAAIWRGGCIIRARFLDRITEAYRADAKLSHLMLAPFFSQVINQAQPAWRRCVSQAVLAGVPVPAFSASLAYFDALRTARLPANLLQAQRDFFGAHTYERIDRPAGQMFHTEWPAIIEDA
jgi:6-phosphogluconate dehydrogenase